MNRTTLLAATALTVTSTGAAMAGGLDRSGQSVLAIFDAPNTLSFAVNRVSPDVTGEDTSVPTGATYDVGNSYSSVFASYSNDINDRLSYAVIFDQPFGADVFYDANPATSLLGGTKADLSSDAISFIGKYDVTERISVFGGVRAERAGGQVALNGQAYAQAISIATVARGAGVESATLGAALAGDPDAVTALGGAGNVAVLGGQVGALQPDFLTPGLDGATGYVVDIEDSWGLGLTLGAAYEIPEIALRLAVTYHSEVSHDSRSTERLSIAPAGDGFGIEDRTRFASPQSINVDFQTGVNEKTLVLASLRWTDWDDFDVIPPTLGADLASIEDSYTWNVGVARRFTDNFVGLASIGYEKDNGSSTVSPLGPNDGRISLSLGGRYTSGNLNVSGGINYTKLGDAFAGVAGQPVALFEGNSAVAVGFKLAYEF